MTITAQDVKNFAVNELHQIENFLGKGLDQAIVMARSILVTLAKDPVLAAAVQSGFADAEAEVMAAVEESGVQVLPAACLAAAVKLAVNVGLTAEHELVAIFKAELQAKLTVQTAGTPQMQNP